MRALAAGRNTGYRKHKSAISPAYPGKTIRAGLTKPAPSTTQRPFLTLPPFLSSSRKMLAALAVVIAAVGVWACTTTYYVPRDHGRAQGLATVAEGLSDKGLARLTADMDPAMLALAKRHDPRPRTDFWGRPVGWTSLNIAEIPNLGFGTTFEETAQEINDLRPVSKLPIRPMRPFNLAVDSGDGTRALRCLSEAVYYESAREPQLGREAVAQVVLNRVRHPAYPKSICGVVYQGSARSTGCQFSFTCDGSLKWAPEPALWSQAQMIARRALNGYVAKSVGSATHYHANYVAPYWAPTLVKMKQIGLHIFYRWTGPWGEPPAFTGRYAGGEAYLSPAILGGLDARTQGLLDPERQGLGGGQKVTLAVAGDVRTYTVIDPLDSDGGKTRVLGQIYASRRKPTADEIKRINESLARLEAGEAAPAAAAVPVAAPDSPTQ